MWQARVRYTRGGEQLVVVWCGESVCCYLQGGGHGAKAEVAGQQSREEQHLGATAWPACAAALLLTALCASHVTPTLPGWATPPPLVAASTHGGQI